jgi:hypothetical protein
MYIQKISSDISAKSLFQDIPDIPFSSQHVICPHCNCVLHVQKTLKSTPVTMDIGAFHAKETILQCPKDKTIFHSEQLRKLTPAKGTFGFDVIVHVGKALFMYSQNNQSIMKDLASQNIPISEREISYLGKKFVTYLSLAHRESREQIRNFEGGKVGIGTDQPRTTLDLNGGVRVGRFTTATRPVCNESIVGTFIFDTDKKKPFVCDGSIWKPLDSDVIILLNLCSQITDSYTLNVSGSDVNHDGYLGLEEVIYVMQKILNVKNY